MADLERDVLSLVRLAMDGRHTDVVALARRLLPAVVERRPDLQRDADALLATLPVRRGRTQATASQPIPVDADSRLRLLRRETSPDLQIEPMWHSGVKTELDEIVSEFGAQTVLRSAGLSPTRSVLLVGPPGVGKTLAARWLALQLRRPLLTLDLSAVMSSFLGRTGNNIRVVLDYAKQDDSILLLDEFDAIAKRRDDASEIGELKRLVTVLLQEIDDWPAGGLLLAATNHPQLLDPAVWRRFDRMIEFPRPSSREIADLIQVLVGESIPQEMAQALGIVYAGRSYADVTRDMAKARRSAILSERRTIDVLSLLIEGQVDGLSRKERLELANGLVRIGWSQRDASQITGVSRDTIRKHLRLDELDIASRDT